MFLNLKKQVQANFMRMSEGDLFQVNIDREEIWNRYVMGFPESERQEHNCNCCKSFLRQYSGIVAIQDGKIVTMWDDIQAPGYNESISAIGEYIRSLPIDTVFLNDFPKCGTDRNKDSAREIIWDHFYIVLPGRFVNKTNMDSVKGTRRTDKEVLHRALKEIPMDVTDTVLELIAQGSLYKGAEFEGNLRAFKLLQRQYAEDSTDNFVWSKISTISLPLCRIRNSAIGTLLVNLAEGMDLDTAVGKYEQITAPTNYKRPTALVTPKMVEQAKEKLEVMGLTGSLERRHAHEADLNAEDILYVDKSSALSDVFDSISKGTIVNPRTLSKTEEINIKDFIEKILPVSTEIEVLLEARHLPNMVSLITASDPTSKSLFKWDNLFSWNYTGGITDSIKERVKAAGGKVDGVLRVSLSWANLDDLDLHVIEPNGNRIYFGRPESVSSGKLDIDMNASSYSAQRGAVENIVWSDQSRMQIGTYQVIVNNYNDRETRDEGYDIQIEYGGELFDINSRTSPGGSKDHQVVCFNYHPTLGIEFTGDIKSSTSQKEKWSLKTNTFHKVKHIMLSPNYWEKQIGNKHFLFFLENCISDEQTRGFFNEFLKDEFTENRKVFEILGSKLTVEPTKHQLSGVGFSETNRNNIIVRVKGQFTRTLKITF